MASAWLAACGGERAPERDRADAEYGGIAVVCATAAPERLNPFVSPAQLPADLRLLLFTPLVLFDDDASFRPHLADDWRFEDDGARVVFRIRNDVSWHDGTRLTAEDVAWTLRTAADTEFGYFEARDFATMVDAVATDRFTVEIQYSRPLTEGLEPFVSLPILPKHLLDGLSPEEFQRADYHRQPIGSGPFHLAGRLPDGSLNFDRVDDYPEELGRPYLDRLVLRTIPETATTLIELETGGVDACITGAGVATDAQRIESLEILVFEPSTIIGLPLDTRRPPFDDARVRRALSAAIRRSEVAAVVSPLTQPAHSLLPPSSPWLKQDYRQVDGDSALAASLLEEAGWTPGADGIRRNAAGDPLRFTMLSWPAMETPLVRIQAQLRRVGADMRLSFMEFSSFISTILDPDRRPEAMAVMLAPSKVVYADHYESFASTGSRNLASFSDAVVDSLFAHVRASGDADAYEELYAALQRRVAEDVPVIYAVYIPRLMVVGNRLEGVRVDLNGPFASVTDWRIPPDRRRRR